MNFSQLLKSDPFLKFEALEKQLIDLDRPRIAHRQLDEKLSAAKATAQRAFDDAPTVANLEKLTAAITARKAFIEADLHAIIEKRIIVNHATLKRAPESLAIYTACLNAIGGELQAELSATRTRLTAAFREAGDDAPNVDAVPATQKLIYQIEEVQNAVLRIAHPSPLSDSDILRILTLIRGTLPAPPAPKAAGHKPDFPFASAHNLPPAPVETPAPALQTRSLLPPSWAELNPKERDARPLNGFRLQPNGPAR